MNIDVAALQMLPVRDEVAAGELCCATLISIICGGTWTEYASPADGHGELS